MQGALTWGAGCWWKCSFCGPGERDERLLRGHFLPSSSTTRSPVLLSPQHVFVFTQTPWSWAVCCDYLRICLPFTARLGALFLFCIPGPGSWFTVGTDVFWRSWGSGRRTWGEHSMWSRSWANKTSRSAAHSLPLLYLSLIKLCEEMS